MFKKGDLIEFNQKGLNLFKYITGSIGVITSDPKKIYEYDFQEKMVFYTYDILVSGQLFIDIPDEFLKRITNNEKDFK